MDLLNEKFPYWNLHTSFGTSRDQLLVLYISYGCNFCVHPRVLSRVSAGGVGPTCTFVQILQFHWTKAKRPSRWTFGWLLNNDNRPISVRNTFWTRLASLYGSFSVYFRGPRVKRPSQFTYEQNAFITMLYHETRSAGLWGTFKTNFRQFTAFGAIYVPVVVRGQCTTVALALNWLLSHTDWPSNYWAMACTSFAGEKDRNKVKPC